MSSSASTAWLSAAARRAPMAVALVAGSLHLTYIDLAGAAQRWQEQLVELDLASPANIGVVVRRTPASVAQLWAIWESSHCAVLLGPDASVVDDPAQLAAWGIGAVIDGENMSLVAADAVANPSHHSWILTSGSSGEPRPVILTHANLAAAVAASQARLGNDATDRWQLALPPAHVGGASVLWRSAAAGGTVVLDERFDAASTARRIGDGAITMTSLVPTMLHRLLDSIDEVSPDVRAVVVGGAAAGDRLVRRGLDAGVPVLATYGLTEASSQVATVAPGAMEAAIGTVGRPLEGMQVTIADPDAAGVGVIWIDGPAVSPGYVGEPPRSGPHRTGDLGRIDEAGRLLVVGRADDVIVTGGEKVIPSVVERALEAHPAVQHAAVIGVPDDEWGQLVVACVVADEGVTAAHVAAEMRVVLKPAQRPKRYVLADNLPLLPNGKVDRAEVLRRVAPDRR